MTVPISVVTLLTSLMAIKTSGQRACLEEKLKQLENLRQRTVPQNETVSCCLLFFPVSPVPTKFKREQRTAILSAGKL